MAVATQRDRRGVRQRTQPARAWTRSDAGSGWLAVLDAEVEERNPLVAQLRTVGIRAEAYDDHLCALVRMGAQPPDVVVVSTGMPAVDLAHLVGVLRAELSMPILLAFRPQEIDGIGPAVAAGALPVVARPYRLPDVLAALQQHWPRRTERVRLTVGDLTLDVDGYEARLGAARVDFTPGEFELVAVLAQHAEHVVLREQLTDRLWPSSPDPHAALVATVARVRRKLVSVGASHAVHTVRGLGYRLEAAGLCAPLPRPARQRD